MTAEERMAYFQGEKRRNRSSYEEPKGKNWDLLFLKLKFLTAVILFVIFLSLDYTGEKIYGIGSGEILQEVTTDFQLPEKLNL